ncbi:Transcriptional activator HAA1 [Wickerhamomyces ciferrii]|uniref:Transcriptional activator HAA1 n=1 Tax=Wickerhamomyces ciferrii (strain ATCC 14091 / BCRC 22168 / CBS 111 / JCM 3599 / NBRC 0793 / NRRL Y-1031 F-60-10) TaxID=1206466 RepID=K0KHZ9_WICCF|nr:Transcriptional activator HAA1 [Wickerhamomyces ciferrii]CCH44830.1 Transcriptional activator HAA1 [Wickerhamomyces ciferrii]
MVLIGGVKYACERCIRGHRVTTCNHTDQPLMMIKPKGRPSSQCKHCKELRKNKNSHPSGSCTCGKKKNGSISSSTSSGAIHKCSCKTGEPCQCHGRRKKIDSKLSQSKSPSEDVSSSNLSLTNGSNDSNHSLNPSNSSTFNWRNNSYSSTSQTPQQQQNVRVRQIGMDPLTNAKPVSDQTRTRVGEVSVPINEYIPNNSNGIGNVNDKMPDVFFQDVPLPFEPGHGLLDLFANSNNATSINPYFHDDPRNDLPTRHNQQQYNNSNNNKIRSPSEASNNGFNNQNFQRTDSAMSLSSMGSNSNLNSRFNASSDSLASGNNNYHHYDNMIHKHNQIQNHQNFNNINNNNNNHNHQQYQHLNGYTNNNSNQNQNNDDTSSIQSVEVLSLTPSFMDIPTDFKNDKGYFSNDHGHQQQQQHQNESFKNHRFTPSIDSIQSGQSSNNKNNGIHLNFDQSSTIPTIHSNLINNEDQNSNDLELNDELNIPRELNNLNNDELNFNDNENSLFNNFNTKLTTSGL